MTLKKNSKNTSQKNFSIEEIFLKKGEVITITPDMIISDVAAVYPQTLKVFERLGIHCVGCYASSFESIEEGCFRHHLNPEEICKMLNSAIRP